MHRELELLAQVGVDLLDILRAATTLAADALGLSRQVGTLERLEPPPTLWRGRGMCSRMLSVYKRSQTVIVAGEVI